MECEDWRASDFMHSLQLKDVISGYGRNSILNHVSFLADKPGIYVVLGTNGAGKTTLFRSIAGVIEPFSGEVLLDGDKIGSAKARDRIGYLSHDNAIPEEMSVFDAITFWAHMENKDGTSPEEIIDSLDLDEFRNKKFSDLSAGQKKRVSIATIFLKERDLYLLDEPTATLDPLFSKKIRDTIRKMSDGKLVLYSSHNLYEATDIGKHLLLVRNGTVEYYDDISSIHSTHYRVGIKASDDISNLVDATLGEGGYYTLTLSNREEAAILLRKLVESGILVYEMRLLDNPLQEIFDSGN
jgi:ABC-2 type transport system ATP-binding protein